MIKRTASKKNPNHAAFTLVELAIVLTVIGIVIAGIITGQGLIQTAKMNELIANLQSYKKAYEAFDDQYHAFPGDMIDATSVLTPFSGITVHNGDGDNIIEHGAGLNEGEPIDAWNHLAMAGYIKGKYRTDAAASNAEAIGYNIPAGPHKGSAFYMVNTFENADGTWPFMITPAGFINDLQFSYENALLFSNSIFYQSYSDLTNNAIITARDAYGIDKKIDDGIGHSGSVSGIYSHGASHDCFDGDYQVQIKEPVCTLLFNLEKRAKYIPD